jgi:RNA polymerase sigma factor (sigma-70 family)
MMDGQLLERFVARRDEAAFATLVLRHGPMVLGVCRQVLHDPHEAEDAFQATFLVLVRNAGTIRKQDSLSSWLYGVAYRIAMRAKQSARRRAYAGQGVEMAAIEPDGDHLDRGELKPILHDEINRLPEKYRAPIVLCYFEGQTHEEAAQRLEWPIGTVKGRLARARELLRTRLDRRGLALPLGLIAMLLSPEVAAVVPRRLVEETVRAAMRVAAAGVGADGDLLSDSSSLEDESVTPDTDQPAGPERSTTARPSRKSRPWLIIGGTVAVAVLLLIRTRFERPRVSHANPALHRVAMPAGITGVPGLVLPPGSPAGAGGVPVLPVCHPGGVVTPGR